VLRDPPRVTGPDGPDALRDRRLPRRVPRPERSRALAAALAVAGVHHPRRRARRDRARPAARAPPPARPLHHPGRGAAGDPRQPRHQARRRPAAPPAVLPPTASICSGRHQAHELPSGHTVTAFVLFGVLACHFRAGGCAAATAAAAGLSRVTIGVHWPIDVIAGAFIGLASAWAAVHLAHRLRWGVNPYCTSDRRARLGRSGPAGLRRRRLRQLAVIRLPIAVAALGRGLELSDSALARAGAL